MIEAVKRFQEGKKKSRDAGSSNKHRRSVTTMQSTWRPKRDALMQRGSSVTEGSQKKKTAYQEVFPAVKKLASYHDCSVDKVQYRTVKCGAISVNNLLICMSWW